jgi:hypothetical protein
VTAAPLLHAIVAGVAQLRGGADRWLTFARRSRSPRALSDCFSQSSMAALGRYGKLCIATLSRRTPTLVRLRKADAGHRSISLQLRAAKFAKDDGLAFELPLVLGSGWICEDHLDQLSAPSPRTRFTVRAVRR